ERDAVGQVFLDPCGGHGGRGLGLLAGLPQADRQALLVAQVGHPVPGEPRLALELVEHPRLGGVGDLLEGALGDVVGCHAQVLHLCLSILLMCVSLTVWDATRASSRANIAPGIRPSLRTSGGNGTWWRRSRGFGLSRLRTGSQLIPSMRRSDRI